MSSHPYPDLINAADQWHFKPEPDLLAGRTLLITGAGDGIGAVLAKTCALYGANVVLLGRTRSKLESIFDWIEANTDTQPVIVPVDLVVLDESAVTALRDHIEETYGVLHGIVHNASLLGPKVPIAHYPYNDWQQVMQVNVNAAFLLTQGLYTLLDEADDACVSFVSSSVGRAGRAYWGAYAASKFALEGLSQILADETENAGKIRVYSVNPGATRTRMRSQAYPMEDPQTVITAEAHMGLFLHLLGGSAHGLALPPQGAQLTAAEWHGTNPLI